MIQAVLVAQLDLYLPVACNIIGVDLSLTVVTIFFGQTHIPVLLEFLEALEYHLVQQIPKRSLI